MESNNMHGDDGNPVLASLVDRRMYHYHPDFNWGIKKEDVRARIRYYRVKSYHRVMWVLTVLILLTVTLQVSS